MCKVNQGKPLSYSELYNYSNIAEWGKPTQTGVNSVANLGILSQNLGVFLRHWDFYFKNKTLGFFLGFFRIQKMILNINFLILSNLFVRESYPVISNCIIR